MSNDQKKPPELSVGPGEAHNSNVNDEAPREAEDTNDIDKVFEFLKKTCVSPPPQLCNCKIETVDFNMPSTSHDAESISFSSRSIFTMPYIRLANGFHNSSYDIPSTSQAIENLEELPNEILENQIALLVRLILIKYRMKAPVTKEEMITTIIDYKDHFSDIFRRVHRRMEVVFGLDVIEIDESSYYVSIMKLDLTFDGMHCGEKGIPKTGILILTLAVIFMKGNCASEQEFWHIFSQIGINENDRHFIFGDAKELITDDFVSENYIVYRPRAHDLGHFEFVWGRRAIAETSKIQVLEFLAKIIRSKPSAFGPLYEDALQDAIQRGLANNRAWAIPPVASIISDDSFNRFSYP
ncbi:melanoma-associated antigen B16-like [Suncus etruscus]|uniref:melanoma-associated antigen B16-like n=1 Tax=Suncus etruscus TaxID=109475 RepID=UPI00210F8C29|nr:melanoma-associated antigen B16-like [Suncus etruscus]